MGKFEIAYYDSKTSQREFIECRTKKSADSKLSKLLKAGAVDTSRDYTIMQFDADGDII